MPRKKKIAGQEIPERIVPPSRDLPVTIDTVRNPAILEEIKGYAREGCTMEQIASRLLVTRATLYKWTIKYPEVKEVILEGNRVADDRVEQSLYEMCFPHEEREIIIEKNDSGEIVKQTVRTKHIPANVTAIQYWLQNRRKSDWKNRQAVELEGESSSVSIVYDLNTKKKPSISNEPSD